MEISTRNMNTDEATTALKAALKAAGWTARQVSVRKNYFSLGSSIDVTIRDAAVPLSQVKAIAEDFERIHRCEITGEILGGGNRYLSVRYSDDARKQLEARYVEQIAPVAASLATLPTGHGLTIPGTTFCLFRGHNGYGYTLYLGDERVGEVQDVAGVSYYMATRATG